MPLSFSSRDKVTPLIIAGRPRAGTRYLTDVLNRFEDVAIQSEIPNPVMAAIHRFFRDTDNYYRGAGDSEERGERGPGELAAWQSKKTSLMFALWIGGAQAKPKGLDKPLRYFGYKRPKHEDYFDFYEKVFDQSPPVHIFCVRNFVDNYLSISSRWPGRDVEEVADEYLAALAVYRRMVKRAPGRVLLFNLDDHIAAGVGYVRAQILDPLGLELDSAMEAELEAMGATNRTEADNNAVRRRTLNEAEQAYIATRPKLFSEFAALCAHHEPAGAPNP
ncbi:sulfotransferase [Glycocaulis sp.]